MKKAYSYIRFSRLHQQDGDSKDRQEDSAVAYCKEHNFTLDYSTYLDLGISAFRSRNKKTGALGRFFEACANGRIPAGSALIIESLDRLSRDTPWKSVGLIRDLLDFGIETHITNEKLVIRPGEEDGRDLMFITMLASRAHEESKTKSGRLLSAFSKKREAAKTGQAFVSSTLPWWLIFQDGKIVCPPERRKVVEEIYRLTASGMSSAKIAKALQAKKTPTFRSPRKLKGSKVATISKKPWQPERLRELIWSDAPQGILSATQKTVSAGREFRVPDYYPRIISHELAAEARAALKNNNVWDRGRAPLGGRPCHLLRGIIRRKSDGEWMRYVCQRNGKGGGYNSYYESTSGPRFFVSGKQLETLLLSGLKELTPEALEPITKMTSRRSILQKQVAALARKISNVAKAVEAGSMILVKRLVELEAEQASTLAKLEEEDWKAAAPVADAGGIKLIKGFELESLADPKVRESIAEAIQRLADKIFVGALEEFDIPSIARSGKQEDVRVIKDPTNSRGRKPMGILIHFHGGAKRLIFRGQEGTPPEIFVSARVSA